MIANQTEFVKRWPRWCRPHCSVCFGLMVTAEAFALESEGGVSYSWSCDSCGQGIVAPAAQLLKRPGPVVSLCPSVQSAAVV
jgi:hypothetical protein